MLPTTAPPPGATDESVDTRRTADDRISRAIDLGWRFATLRATTYDEDVQSLVEDGPLRAVKNLPVSERLEVDLLAAEGQALRLGVPLDENKLDRLKMLAVLVQAQNGSAVEFRNTLCELHLSLAKQLWAESEKEGEAYELGIGLFDTWCRILTAYKSDKDVTAEWREVFGPRRVGHMLTLIDDLQSRLDPSAVTVVRDNLKAWRDRVTAGLGRHEAPDAEGKPWREVRSQAIAWRQLLTGDKEPEAYLSAEERAQVRSELIRLMWHRYVPWVAAILPFLVGGVVLFLLNQRDVESWWSHHKGLTTAVTGTVITVAGVLGISRASMVRAARSSLQTWSRLLWNRALARVICRSTLRVQCLFPDPPTVWQRLTSPLRRTAGECDLLAAGAAWRVVRVVHRER
jgi:hypothetical protein